MAIKEVHLAPIGLAVLGSAGLAAIWAVDGLPAIGWMAALAYLTVSTILLTSALQRRRTPRLGWANASLRRDRLWSRSSPDWSSRPSSRRSRCRS